MAQSLPVISTRHAGIPEAVLDGSTGYLVNEGDSAAMAERLITLVRNYDLRRQMGIAGWQRARERFTWRQSF
jgi:glycosyltransferase involved in cell wall biosynthesis